MTWLMDLNVALLATHAYRIIVAHQMITINQSMDFH